jgi:hypothetical protein
VARLSSRLFVGFWPAPHGTGPSDRDSYFISEFDQSDGTFVRRLCAPGLQTPCFGFCLSPDETTLAVACGGAHCILVFRIDSNAASAGEAPRMIPDEPDPDGQFNFPVGVQFSPVGQTLLVADRDSDCVQLISLDGTFVRNVPLGGSARAVAVDSLGNIVAATDRHVKVFSPHGTLLHDRLGGVEMDDAPPGGLAVDLTSGRIVVLGRRGGVLL